MYSPKANQIYTLRKFLPLLLIISLGINSCKTATTQTAEDVPLFSFYRSACFGTCPSYSIEIYNSKKVQYEGFHYVEPIGKVTSTISSEEIKELKKQYAALQIDTHQNLYPIGVPVPQDIPSMVVTSNINGVSKQITIKGSSMPINIRTWIERLEAVKTAVLEKSNIKEEK